MPSLTDNSICVIGLGYVGLPTALTLAGAGYKVAGYDKNPEVASRLSAGNIGINEAGISDLLRAGLASGSFKAHSVIQPANAYFICVPTPIDHASKMPDMTAVMSAVEAIKTVIRPGDLVVLESTSPVGTTRHIHRLLSEHLGGERVLAAYCPERILPGKILEELSSLDRVIGGVDQESTVMAKNIFSRMTKGHCYETDAETAEFVKLAENSFRDVNIAFANELKNLCATHGVDVDAVRRFANMHPRVNILEPGIGVGGHCIPIDPWFLVYNQSVAPSVIRSARETNDRQPRLVADDILAAAKKHGAKKLAIFGLAYKANINDFRESPAVEIVRHVSAAGVCAVQACDPFLASGTHPIDCGGAVFKENPDDCDADLYVFLVAHDAFREYYRRLRTQGAAVLDFCRMDAAAAATTVLSLAKAH